MVPLLSIVIGLVFGAIIMLVFGYNPIEGFKLKQKAEKKKIKIQKAWKL